MSIETRLIKSPLVVQFRNMSSKPGRESSPGILRKQRSGSNPVQLKSGRELNIKIHDPSRPTDPRAIEAEESRFQELKQQYFSQCAPINKNVVQKYSGAANSDDPNQDMNILKTVRSNLKLLNDNKQHNIKDTDARVRKERNSVANIGIKSDVSRRNIRRGCGAIGCDCANCVCGIRCQVDCKCMRQI